VKAAVEEAEKPKEKKVEKKPVAEKKKIKMLVRVAGTDLDGEKPLRNAIMGIKGISHAMSKAICEVGSFNPDESLGSLKEEELARLEAIIKEPKKFGVPSWILSRRKEPESGSDLHPTGADVDMVRKFDIQRMVDLKTYRGTRHMLGLPVRGQRTRSSFRKGRVVGVIKKAIKIALEKSRAEEEKKK
jgi:small subunit ribosomal protein S13